MPNFKLTLEYDGTNFAGWQRQAPSDSIRTVQHEVEKGITAVFHELVNVVASGRTDAGVHARGQIAHAMLRRTDVPSEELHRALLGVLPRDIVCRDVEQVGDDFHARYSAKLRSYSYTLSVRPQAIGRSYAWYPGTVTDPSAMDEIAELVLGEHDFTAYSKENPEVKNRRCTVAHSAWSRDSNLWRYEISADRFVYSMIRALVGTMVAAGRGRLSPREFRTVLDGGDRAKNLNMLAPPHGLCLEQVQY